MVDVCVASCEEMDKRDHFSVINFSKRNGSIENDYS